MEDAKILDLYFARDEDAIRETDTAYGKRLHTLAKNILQNPLAAPPKGVTSDS